MKVDALFGEHLLEGLADFRVHAGGDLVEVFEHRHLGAEAGVDGAEFEADDAGADDDQFLGDLGQLERAGGGDDDLLVDLDALRGLASEPVAMTMFFALWISSPTLTLPAAGIVPQPLSQVILFFLKRNSMPLVLLSTVDCL